MAQQFCRWWACCTRIPHRSDETRGAEPDLDAAFDDLCSHASNKKPDRDLALLAIPRIGVLHRSGCWGGAQSVKRYAGVRRNLTSQTPILYSTKPTLAGSGMPVPEQFRKAITIFGGSGFLAGHLVCAHSPIAAIALAWRWRRPGTCSPSAAARTGRADPAVQANWWR